VLSGTGAVIVDDNEVPVGLGDFVAMSAASTRRVRADESGLAFIAVCAAA
jgi:mannose-6-phosphate isomerase-like protein (cupin superfamily)